FLNINNQRTSYNSNWHGLAIGDVYKSTILNMSVSGTVETNLYNYSGGVAGRITYTLMKNVVSNVNGAYTGFAYKIEESTLENIFVGGNAVNVAFADNISNSKSKFVNIL